MGTCMHSTGMETTASALHCTCLVGVPEGSPLSASEGRLMPLRVAHLLSCVVVERR